MLQVKCVFSSNCPCKRSECSTWIAVPRVHRTLFKFSASTTMQCRADSTSTKADFPARGSREGEFENGEKDKGRRKPKIVGPEIDIEKQENDFSADSQFLVSGACFPLEFLLPSYSRRVKIVGTMSTTFSSSE